MIKTYWWIKGFCEPADALLENNIKTWNIKVANSRRNRLKINIAKLNSKLVRCCWKWIQNKNVKVIGKLWLNKRAKKSF